MIQFRPRKIDRNNNNTPILSNREIDDFAHAVLADYRLDLLRRPGKIDFQHFLESYLGMRIIFQDIYSDDPERPILAITAFQKGKIKVFDEENESVEKIIVPARSVVIDNSLMEEGREHIALFTGMHEGGHITMQWHVYTGKTFDGEIYDPEYDFEYIEPIVCCRRDNIERKPRLIKDRTAEQWREHHADYFAGAITMPNATFIPFVNKLLRDNNFYKGFITLGIDEDLDILAEDILPDAIKETYGVSKRAAGIKLKNCGFIKG